MSIVFFDFETAGLLPTSPNIQLAAIAVDSEWNELETFERKIMFAETLADPAALALNHYDRETWEREAKPAPQVVAEFSEFLKRHASIEMTSRVTGRPYSVARLAGHNASTFDGPRLKAMFGPQFLPAHPQCLDTLQLALWQFLGTEKKPKTLRLGDICEWYGIGLLGAHDALTDVRGCIAITKAMIEQQQEVAA